MANTTSARKAARKIARRTEINKARRSRMRSAVRQVEEAIAAGDRNKALEAMKTGRAAADARRAPGPGAPERREPQGLAADASDRQARASKPARRSALSTDAIGALRFGARCVSQFRLPSIADSRRSSTSRCCTNATG